MHRMFRLVFMRPIGKGNTSLPINTPLMNAAFRSKCTASESWFCLHARSRSVRRCNESRNSWDMISQPIITGKPRSRSVRFTSRHDHKLLRWSVIQKKKKKKTSQELRLAVCIRIAYTVDPIEIRIAVHGRSCRDFSFLFRSSGTCSGLACRPDKRGRSLGDGRQWRRHETRRESGREPVATAVPRRATKKTRLVHTASTTRVRTRPLRVAAAETMALSHKQPPCGVRAGIAVRSHTARQSLAWPRIPGDDGRRPPRHGLAARKVKRIPNRLSLPAVRVRRPPPIPVRDRQLVSVGRSSATGRLSGPTSSTRANTPHAVPIFPPDPYWTHGDRHVHGSHVCRKHPTFGNSTFFPFFILSSVDCISHRCRSRNPFEMFAYIRFHPWFVLSEPHAKSFRIILCEIMVFDF